MNLTNLPILQFCNVSVAYQNKQMLLKNINFVIHNNQTIGVIGSSGAGKTTIFKTILNQTKIVKGKLIYSNKNILQTSKKQWRKLMRSVGYLSPEFCSLPDDQVYLAIKREMINQQPWWQKILFYLRFNQRLQIYQILEDLNILEKAFTNIKDLSQGQKQRVEIAKLLIKKPRLILADEPTTFLDQKNAYMILQLILQLGQKYKCGIIINLHDISLLKMVHEIVAIKNGKILFQKPSFQVSSKDLDEVYK